MRIGRVTDGEQVRSVEFDGAEMHALEGDGFDRRRTGERVDGRRGTPLAPCVPTTVLVLSRGWNPIDGWTAEAAADAAGVTVEHARRWLDGTELPGETPFVNPKVTSEVTGDGAEIRVPAFVTLDVWVEPELAVVVGSDVYRASREDAADAIFGYTVFNDVTAREFLEPHKDYFRAKCNETFASMGPWIETSIAEDDVDAGLAVECRVNGETRVRSNTQRTAVRAERGRQRRLDAHEAAARRRDRARLPAAAPARPAGRRGRARDRGHRRPPQHGGRRMILSSQTIATESFEERVRAAADAGCAGIGLRAKDYTRARAAGLSDDDMRALLAQHDVVVAELQALRTWADPDGDEAEAEALYAVADAVGGSYVIAIAPELPEGEGGAAERLAAVADDAAGHGLTVALEFIPWTGVAGRGERLEARAGC